MFKLFETFFLVKTYRIFYAIFLFTFASGACLSQQTSEKKLILNACYSDTTVAKPTTKSIFSVPLALIRFYQLIVSKQISANCEFNPSCSNFSIQAIKNKGLIKGILMTADRLMRCNGHSHTIAQPYLINTKTGKINDPAQAY